MVIGLKTQISCAYGLVCLALLAFIFDLFLGEAVPENLKNMLLVMCNAGVFEEDNNYLVER